MDTPAENMLQKRDKKKELHDKTTLMDIIAAEFKYNYRCRRDVMMEDRETFISGR